MEKYFDSALLIAAIGLLLHIHRAIDRLERKLCEHIDGHRHIAELKEKNYGP